MGTPHINAEKGEFSNVVLIAGDPNRAKWIAETYLHDVKQVNAVRGALGYTGLTKNNKRISVMTSGMGQPSIGIYSYELYSYFDVDIIIRIGTCGVYQPQINLFDVLIAATASTDSNWASQYKLNGTYSAGADFDLVLSAVDAYKKNNIPFHAGNVLSADVFYDDDKDTWKSWAKMGVLGVEMESYALYCNAARLGKKALCLLTATDHFVNKVEKATVEQRTYGLARMVEGAIEVAEKYAK